MTASRAAMIDRRPSGAAGLVVPVALSCCDAVECRCPCGCRQHPRRSGGVVSHYRFCDDCASRWHLEPLPIRAARAFGQLPPSPRGRLTADRLAHHRTPGGPELVR